MKTTSDWSDPLFNQYRSYNYLGSGIRCTDRVTICSDGGVCNSTAGFGVVFSINETIVASTMMKITPSYNEFTSYRSEAMGMLGAMLMYEKLQNFTKLKCGTRATILTTIISDNEALVKTVNRIRIRPITPKFFYTPDANIINEIMILIRTISSFGEMVHVKHVRGHQDQNSLTYRMKLN
jgi:hypothetical protein